MSDKIFYSGTTRGFYSKAVHDSNIPVDTVEITTEQHLQLLAAQSAGAIIRADDNGYPVAVFPSPPTLSARQSSVWELIKTERSARMSGGSKVSGKWFHTDQNPRLQHLGLKDSARDLLAAGAVMSDAITINGQQVVWKTMDGTFAPMTLQLAFDIVEADKALDAALFIAAETHRAQMMAAADPDTYDYTTGWPERFAA